MVMCRCGFHLPYWKHFSISNWLLSFWFEGLTACVSYQWAAHLFRGRFVYVDIIQNGLQFVTADVKLKKLLSDKVAFNDSSYEWIRDTKSWSLCLGWSYFKLILLSLYMWCDICRVRIFLPSLQLLGCQPVKPCSETCLKEQLTHLKEFHFLWFLLDVTWRWKARQRVFHPDKNKLHREHWIQVVLSQFISHISKYGIFSKSAENVQLHCKEYQSLIIQVKLQSLTSPFTNPA